MALVEKKINVAYESSVQEVLSKVANVADKTTLDQILTAVTELKNSVTSSNVPDDGDIVMAFVSGDNAAITWAFEQHGIGKIINSMYKLNCDELVLCDTVDDIVESVNAVKAISNNEDASTLCYKNDKLATALNNVDELILVSGKGYQTYNIGDIVSLNYGGVNKKFIVAHKDYMTPNKIVLVNVDTLDEKTQWAASRNNYSSCSLRTYLNSTILSKFSSQIQNAMVTSPVSCHNYRTATTCNDKIWAPSCTEVGLSNDDAPIEGSKLSAFTDKITLSKGYIWWLRTPRVGDASKGWGVSAEGYLSSYSVIEAYDVICAFEI